MSDPPRPKSGAILGVLGALTAFGPLSIDMYLPALPTIQRELTTSAAATQRTLSAYFFGLALSQLAYGPLSDRFGRRRPLFLGLTIYLFSSIGAALAPSISVLAAMRTLQAMGAAAGTVVTRAVVRDLYSGRAAASALSTLILIMGAAPIFAPLLGGAILEVASWRAIFAFLAVCGALGIVGAALVLPETGVRSRPTGILRTYGSLFGDRGFVAYTLIGGFGNAGLFAYIAAYPFVVIDLHHVSPRHFGFWFGANAVAYIAMAQLNRLLLRRASPAQLVTGSTTVACVFAAATLWVVRAGLSLPYIAVCVFLFVGNLALVGPNSVALAMEDQSARAGAASALLGTIQFTIAATASYVVGALGEKSAKPMATVMLACTLLALATRAVATRDLSTTEPAP